MDKTQIDYSDKILKLYELLWDDFHKISFKQFKKYKFSAHQAMVIKQLFNTPYITLKELGEKLSLPKSTLSGIVDKLEKKNFLIREIPEDNRRTIRLSLSPKFKEEYDFVYVQKSYLVDAIKNTDDEDMKKIIYGLEKFHDILDLSIKSINFDEEE